MTLFLILFILFVIYVSLQLIVHFSEVSQTFFFIYLFGVCKGNIFQFEVRIWLNFNNQDKNEIA
jgi:hypothetical protein